MVALAIPPDRSRSVQVTEKFDPEIYPLPPRRPKPQGDEAIMIDYMRDEGGDHWRPDYEAGKWIKVKWGPIEL